jgi:beta-1,2-mannobiose phosphorylase / 1,2-beta-oligomannan phosphorylase
MLLDLDNPQKILARSREPILEPNEHYENNGWKAGVSYSCGAVEKDGQLLIYYGGADTVSCVAQMNLNEFVDNLIETEKPKIKVCAQNKQDHPVK